MINKDREIKDREIPPGILGMSIDVCILQLKSPFWDEMYEDELDGQKIFGMPTKPDNFYEKRTKRIHNLLVDIENKFSNVDIILFPEYSLEKEMMDELKLNEFAKKNKSIIIGNYYDKKERHSTTFIIIPDPNHEEGFVKYEAIKQTQSKYDVKYLTPSDEIFDENKKILRFWWNTNIEGKEVRAFLQIFTCKDFSIYGRSDLQDKEGKKVVDTENNGMILVPSCTNFGMDEWRSKAMDLLRDGQDNNKNIITIFANSVDVSNKKQGLGMCGESKIVTVFVDEKETKIEGNSEGVILCTLNPFYPVYKVSPKTSSNVILLDSTIREIDENGKIVKRAFKPAKLGMSIHPEAYKKLNLAKFYMFFKLLYYWEYRDKLKTLSIKGHGIYGVHDVLCQSYEENGDIDKNSYISLRVSEGMGLRDQERDKIIEDHFYLKIERIIKFHGTPTYTIDDEGNLSPKYEILKEIEVEDHLNDIKKILHGDKSINKKKLLDENICIKVEDGLEESDRSDKEKEEGYGEFLVFLNIQHVPKGDKKEFFIKHILPELIKNKNVRTIEEVESAKGDIDVHFILHVVVEKIEDLGEVVIHKIHKQAYEQDIKLGTRVIIPAEKLSDGKSPVLSEVILSKQEDKDIIKYLVTSFYEDSFLDPFSIRRLHDKEIKRVIKFYRESQNFIKKCIYSELKSPVESDRNKFIFGISHILTKVSDDLEKVKDSNDVRLLQYYCGIFFSNIEPKMEKLIYDATRRIARSIGEEKFLNLINHQLEISQRKKKEPRRGFENSDLRTTTLGNHVQILSFWNSVCKNGGEGIKEKDKIPAEFIKDIKRAQTLPEMRNWFSHRESYTGDFTVPSKEDVLKILDNTIWMLEFILKYETKQV